MAKINLNPSNVMEQGGVVLSTTLTTSATVRSKVALNRQHREKATFYCTSEVDGDWSILDVDTDGDVFEIIELPVLAGVPSIYSHNHVMSGGFCRFTPTGVVSNSDLKIRVLYGTKE